MEPPSIALCTPGENPPEDCWLLDWLEPVLPEPPTYVVALKLLLQRTEEPQSIGSMSCWAGDYC